MLNPFGCKFRIQPAEVPKLDTATFTPPSSQLRGDTFADSLPSDHVYGPLNLVVESRPNESLSYIGSAYSAPTTNVAARALLSFSPVLLLCRFA